MTPKRKVRLLIIWILLVSKVITSHIVTQVQNSPKDRDSPMTIFEIFGGKYAMTAQAAMSGKHSGVLTKFKQNHPNIVLWHCMCHRLEQAVYDSIKAGVGNLFRTADRFETEIFSGTAL